MRFDTISILPGAAMFLLLLGDFLFFGLMLGDWRKRPRSPQWRASLFAFAIWLPMLCLICIVIAHLSAKEANVIIFVTTLISIDIFSWNRVDRKFLKLKRYDVVESFCPVPKAMLLANFIWNSISLSQGWLRILITAFLSLVLILLVTLPVRLYVRRKAPQASFFF